jgi:hypothetical protein
MSYVFYIVVRSYSVTKHTPSLLRVQSIIGGLTMASPAPEVWTGFRRPGGAVVAFNIDTEVSAILTTVQHVISPGTRERQIHWKTCV